MNHNENPKKGESLFRRSWVDDGRIIRWAIFLALTLHILFFFFIGSPSWSQPKVEANVTRIHRPPNVIFEAEEVELTPPPVKRELEPYKVPVPVPDSTPYEPEPILPPKSEPVIVVSPDVEFEPQGWEAPIVSKDPVPLDGTMVAPVVLHKEPAKYPAIAARAGVQGVVRLRAVIHVDGTVGDIEVVSSLGRTGCDEAAIEALKKYRFEPATQNGVAVTVYMILEVTFRLK